MKTTITNIRKSLKALGYSGRASIEYVQADRVLVSVNGEYIGLYDSEKNTFVN